MIDKIQKQRFELKYRITEAKARQIRYFVQTYLECDRYGAGNEDLSYPVHSLYLDSKDLRTFRDTINGSRNRFKLRIRYYDSDDSPVFFEIKRRYNRVIHKKRARVHRWAVVELLGGQLPAPEHLVHNTPGQLDTLEQFCILKNKLQADPQVHVSYNREAYEKDHSNAVRITFDRNVQSCRSFGTVLPATMSNPLPVFGKNVILELKFTDRFPHWLEELTQLFHLRRESAAKYVDGIIRLKEKKLELI